MKVNIFKWTFEIKFSVGLSKNTLAKDIIKETQINGYKLCKIPLIKSARKLNSKLGLKESKELVEDLFEFSRDGEFGGDMLRIKGNDDD